MTKNIINKKYTLIECIMQINDVSTLDQIQQELDKIEEESNQAVPDIKMKWFKKSGHGISKNNDLNDICAAILFPNYFFPESPPSKNGAFGKKISLLS